MGEAPVESQESLPSGAEIDDIDVQIATVEARLSNYRNRRAFYYVVGAILVLGSLIMVFGRHIFSGPPFDVVSRQAPLIGFGIVGYCMFGLGYVAILRQSHIASSQQELDVLRAKRRILGRSGLVAATEGSSPAYFDRLVDINVSNLEAYYGLVKVHTNNSFQVAISAGCVGFLLIITGLILGFTNLTNAESISYLSAGAGIVTEFIASVFFYLYNRTVRQLKEYHDSLIRVQNILLSFKIVGDTKDDNRKNILMELMMKCLIATRPDLVSARDAETVQSEHRP